MGEEQQIKINPGGKNRNMFFNEAADSPTEKSKRVLRWRVDKERMTIGYCLADGIGLGILCVWVCFWKEFRTATTRTTFCYFWIVHEFGVDLGSIIRILASEDYYLYEPCTPNTSRHLQVAKTAHTNITNAGFRGLGACRGNFLYKLPIHRLKRPTIILAILEISKLFGHWRIQKLSRSYPGAQACAWTGIVGMIIPRFGFTIPKPGWLRKKQLGLLATRR